MVTDNLFDTHSTVLRSADRKLKSCYKKQTAYCAVKVLEVTCMCLSPLELWCSPVSMHQATQ